MSGDGLPPPSPSPIANVLVLPADAPACTGGRVVASEPWRALIADASGTLEVRHEAEPLELGAWVVARGIFDGTTLTDADVWVVGAPQAPFPTPDGEWHRLHEDGAKRLLSLRFRSRARAGVRRFFEARGFLEVETPLAVPSPGLDLHVDAVGAIGLAGERWLVTSPEYHMKRLLAAGLPRIFQLARCFRRGEVGAHHEPEFTMLEWYRAFAGSDAVMEDTEALVAALATELLGTTAIPARGRAVDVAAPWERLTVAEAFSRHADLPLDEALEDEEGFFRTWVERVEPELGHPRPTFVTHWPASMASLARLHPDDPRWADRVEAYVDGLELSNGFGELIDAREQRARLERDRDARAREGRDAYPIDERFLAALAEGLPPAGGNALGFDRLVMLLLGATHIEDVLAFPQSRL